MRVYQFRHIRADGQSSPRVRDAVPARRRDCPRARDLLIPAASSGCWRPSPEAIAALDECVVSDAPSHQAAAWIARLAHHAEAAGDAEAVLELAPKAAYHSMRGSMPGNRQFILAADVVRVPVAPTARPGRLGTGPNARTMRPSCGAQCSRSRLPSRSPWRCSRAEARPRRRLPRTSSSKSSSRCRGPRSRSRSRTTGRSRPLRSGVIRSWCARPLRSPTSARWRRRSARSRPDSPSRFRRPSIRWHYGVALDGVSVLLPASDLARLRALPGVTVWPTVTYHALPRHSLLQLDDTADPGPNLIGATALWGQTLATAGQGIKIGLVDDGIDQAHPYFNPSGYSYPAGFPKGNTAYTTPKVIVARAFPSPSTHWKYADRPFDPMFSFHATHVAGIAAGDHDTPTAPNNAFPSRASLRRRISATTRR